MPLSVGGGQLPLSAFFPSSGPSRSSKRKVSTKRKAPPDPGQVTEPPKKKSKRKENLVPSHNEDLEDATSLSKPGTSKTPRRRTFGLEMVIDSSDRRVEEEDDAFAQLVDRRRANISTKNALIDLTLDGSDDVTGCSPPDRTHHLETPPLTPEVQNRRRDRTSITSLPSPPLTAPDAKKSRKKREDEQGRKDVLELPQVSSVDAGTRPALPDVKGAEMGATPSDGLAPQPHVLEHKEPCPSSSLQSSRDLMPPPPLPLKALLPVSCPLSPTMPIVRRPRSVASEKWVPSSQTQEQSMSREADTWDGQSTDEAPRGRPGRVSQIVPSSQLSERGLEPLHGFSDKHGSDRKSLSTPVLAGSGPGVTTHLQDGDQQDLTSHDVVESSQSQSEIEITAAWIDKLAAGREEMLRPKTARAISPPSSPPRAVETQDYDAQDEYSPSMDESSQSPTLKDPRTCPLPALASTESGSDEYEESTSSAAPQGGRISETFEGRDESGNALPRDEHAGLGWSRSSSPRQGGRRRLHVRVHDTSPLRSPGRDEVSAPSLPAPSPEDCPISSSRGSSLPSASPLFKFLAMFSQSGAEDESEFGPSQGQDDDADDF